MRNIWHYLFFLQLLYILTGCSTLRSLTESNSITDFSPPLWIQGTWNNGVQNTFEFSENNVIFTSFNNSYDFKKIYKNQAKDYEATNFVYEFQIDSSGQNFRYRFEKIDNKTMKWFLFYITGEIITQPILLFKN